MKKTFIIFTVIINLLFPMFVSADDYHLKNNGEDIKIPYNLPQKNSVVKIYRKMKNDIDYGFGTGIFLNNHFILTAAHNLVGDSGDNNLDNIEDLGFTTEIDANIEPVLYNNEFKIKNTKTYSLKNTSLKNKTIHFFDLENYNDLIKSKTIDSRKYDLVLIEVKEETITVNKNEEPKLVEKSIPLTNNDSIYFLGYPGMEYFQVKSSDGNPITNKIKTGKIYKVSGPVITYEKNSPILLYDTSTIGGMSGAGVFNKKNELIGLHLFFVDVKDSNDVYSGGLKFSNNQINWINSFIGKTTKKEENEKDKTQTPKNKEETSKSNNDYTYIILVVTFGLAIIVFYKEIKKN